MKEYWTRGNSAIIQCDLLSIEANKILKEEEIKVLDLIYKMETNLNNFSLFSHSIITKQ